MTPHACTVIPDQDQEIFRRVEIAVNNLPDGLRDEKGQPIEISCHMLARAVGAAFKLRWVDGYFILPSYHHSWLLTPNGNIIDVYPIGTIGGPLLLDRQRCFAHSSAYIALPTAIVSKKQFADSTFRKHVAILHRELKKQARLPL